MDENIPVRINGTSNSGRSNRGRTNNIATKSIFKRLNKKAVSMAIGILVLVSALSFAGMYFYQSTMGANIDGGKYQAVFFTNGQVYFGKLHTLNGGYMKLTDIFYLQTKTASASDNPQVTSDQTSTDVELIKLGNEIHGPVDEMMISKDQILFFENLKADGKVARSINQYLKK